VTQALVQSSPLQTLFLENLHSLKSQASTSPPRSFPLLLGLGDKWQSIFSPSFLTTLKHLLKRFSSRLLPVYISREDSAGQPALFHFFVSSRDFITAADFAIHKPVFICPFNSGPQPQSFSLSFLVNDALSLGSSNPQSVLPRVPKLFNALFTRFLPRPPYRRNSQVFR